MDAAPLIGALDAHVDLIGNLRKPTGMEVAFHAASQDSETADKNIKVEHLHGSYSNGVARPCQGA